MEIPLNKIAVAPDNSFAELKRLLDAGYDKFRFVRDAQETCPVCDELAARINSTGGRDLAHLLGYKKIYQNTYDEQGNEVPLIDAATNQQAFTLSKVVDVYRDAPIYNLSHVGCNCYLLVFKSNDPNQAEIVTKF